MSTKANIVRQKPNGSFEWIYCQWDGYPEYVGVILVKHYTSDEKIKSLMELGDISCLGPEIGEQKDFNYSNYLVNSQCIAYHRDRGDTLNPARVADTWSTLEKALALEGQADYVYVYMRHEWLVGHIIHGRLVASPLDF